MTDAYDVGDAFLDLPEPIVLPPADLLSNYETINVLAPLVRCSKLPFRLLCSLYETHITHTPMILAQEFSRSQTARISDFSSSVHERGVFWMEPRGHSSLSSGAIGQDNEGQIERKYRHVSYQTPQAHNRLPPSPYPPTPKSELVRGLLLAQFASPNAGSLADAAELIAPYIDGLDINCGCPQKWAFHEGIGCALLRKPELVADMIRCTKDRMGWGWPVSIKIRIDPEEQ
jgi:tRNA-dihydrouridine synthase 4